MVAFDLGNVILVLQCKTLANHIAIAIGCAFKPFWWLVAK